MSDRIFDRCHAVVAEYYKTHLDSASAVAMSTLTLGALAYEAKMLDDLTTLEGHTVLGLQIIVDDSVPPGMIDARE